jgi:hypothetical protein
MAPVSGFVAGRETVGRQPLFIDLIEDVGELRRVEDLAAQLAHNKFSVLLAGDNADLRMFA